MIHLLLVKCLEIVVISLYKSTKTHIVPVISLLNTLKGTAITLPETILYYSTLSGTN